MSATIWVDADACPRPARELLCRAADRAACPTTFVANRAVRLPSSPYLSFVTVPQGFDVADERIVDEISAGDLVVTADIPLAGAALERGASVIDFRGQTLDEDNIGERLATRQLMEELRDVGVVTGGPKAYGRKDAHAFAAALDRWLAKRRGGGSS